MVQGRRAADRVHRATVRVRRGPVQANRESVQGDREPDGADRETDQVSLLSVGGRRVRVPEDRVLVQPDRAVGGLNRVPALAGQVSRAQSRSTGAVIRVCSPMMRDWTSRRRDTVGAKWYLGRAVWHARSQGFPVFRYVETWYNRRRRHSTLGYISPVEYEMQLREAA